jgi:hypothetical protein
MERYDPKNFDIKTRFMKKLSIFIAITVIALTAQSALAQGEKELVIRTAKALATAPLEKETQRMEEKALRWTIETNDVHLIACGGVFSMFSDKKNKNSPDMTSAYMIGMAAFRLENPTKDENATQLAGLELALKVYEALVQDKPKNKHDGIEALIAKRDKGELAGAVAAANCGK